MLSITKRIKDGYKLIEREEFEEWLDKEYQRSMKYLVQRTIEEDFNEQMGVSLYERNSNRKSYRNGYYYRSLYTKYCLIEGLKIPRSRTTKINYKAFDKWQKMHENFKDLIVDLILTGSSYYEIENYLCKEMPISRSSISNILKGLYHEVQQFHREPLKDDIKVLYLDGVWHKIKKLNIVVLTILGIDINGNKKILDFLPYYKGESEEAWHNILNRVYSRGLKGENLELIVRDGCKGIKNAARVVFPFAKQQSCLFHIKKNILKKVRQENKKVFAKDLRFLFNAKNRNIYQKRFTELSNKYIEVEKNAIKYIKNIEEDAFTYFEFPIKLRKYISTNNYIERYFGSDRAFTKRRNSFQNLKSVDSFMFIIAFKYNSKEIFIPNWRDLW